MKDDGDLSAPWADDDWRARDPDYRLMGPEERASMREADALIHSIAGKVPARRRTPPRPNRKIKLTAASAVEPKRIDWLLPGRVPIGALTVLAGMPGVGKSQIALDWAARASRGEIKALHGETRSTLIYATEDACEHVIVPRLIAAGADLDLIHFVSVSEADAKGVEVGASLTLPVDTDALSDALIETNAIMCVFDPLVSVMDAKLNPNQDRELRTSLEPLVAMLEKCQAVGIGLMHFRKSGGEVLDRLMGGRGFGALPRSVLAAVEDEDGGEMVLSLIKTNYGDLSIPGLRYKVATAPVVIEGTIELSPRIEWLGETDGAGRDVTRDLLDDGRDRSTRRREAGDWLLTFLRGRGGSEWSETIKTAAGEAGITTSALQRGRAKVGVLTARTGDFKARTYWHLPDAEHPPLSPEVSSEVPS